jgi:hypothetical protein
MISNNSDVLVNRCGVPFGVGVAVAKTLLCPASPIFDLAASWATNSTSNTTNPFAVAQTGIQSV